MVVGKAFPFLWLLNLRERLFLSEALSKKSFVLWLVSIRESPVVGAISSCHTSFFWQLFVFDSTSLIIETTKCVRIRGPVSIHISDRSHATINFSQTLFVVGTWFNLVLVVNTAFAKPTPYNSPPAKWFSFKWHVKYILIKWRKANFASVKWNWSSGDNSSGYSSNNSNCRSSSSGSSSSSNSNISVVVTVVVVAVVVVVVVVVVVAIVVVIYVVVVVVLVVVVIVVVEVITLKAAETAVVIVVVIEEVVL